jgi:diketogulonate reductase-like aldo/keto reductase
MPELLLPPCLKKSLDEIMGTVEQLATTKGWKMSEVALIWHKSKGSVPIVGLDSVDKVHKVRGLWGKSLPDEEVAFLDEAYVPRPVAIKS